MCLGVLTCKVGPGVPAAPAVPAHLTLVPEPWPPQIPRFCLKTVALGPGAEDPTEKAIVFRLHAPPPHLRQVGEGSLF